MHNSFTPFSDEMLAKLVFESQTTMQRMEPATNDVFGRVKKFIQLFARLPTKPKGTALLYEEPGSARGRYRDLDRQLIIGRLPKSERNPDGSDLAVDDAQMSKTHFEIRLTEGLYVLRDLNSRNGTYLNEDSNRIQEQVLKAGDAITAGTTLFVFTGRPFTAEPQPLLH